MIDDLSLLYKGYLLVSAPFLVIAFMIGARRAAWQIKEYLLVFLVTPLWLLLIVLQPYEKTLANYGLEPIFLGIGVGIIFVVVVLVSKGNRQFRFRLLCFCLILWVFVIRFGMPPLEEKDYTVSFPILKFLF